MLLSTESLLIDALDCLPILVRKGFESTSVSSSSSPTPTVWHLGENYPIFDYLSMYIHVIDSRLPFL